MPAPYFLEQDKRAFYNPYHCLFCPIFSPTFAQNITHMHQAHGLFSAAAVTAAPHTDLAARVAGIHWAIYTAHVCPVCQMWCATSRGALQHVMGEGASGYCKMSLGGEGVAATTVVSYANLCWLDVSTMSSRAGSHEQRCRLWLDGLPWDEEVAEAVAGMALKGDCCAAGPSEVELGCGIEGSEVEGR